MAFKKITITDYKKNGELAMQAIYTLRNGIEANDFKQAKELVAKTLLVRTLESKNCFTVMWQRDGFVEGYLVKR